MHITSAKFLQSTQCVSTVLCEGLHEQNLNTHGKSMNCSMYSKWWQYKSGLSQRVSA